MAAKKRDDNELRREWVESRSRQDLRRKLEWVRTAADMWLAEGNVAWRVHRKEGSDDEPDFGCTPMLEGDWGSFESETAAKAYAERCEAELPLHEVAPSEGSLSVTWLVTDMDCPPIEPQPARLPQELAGRCENCGSGDAPIFWKPLQNSMSWWSDPSGSWACSMCQKDLLCPDWEKARARARGEED